MPELAPMGMAQLRPRSAGEPEPGVVHETHQNSAGLA